MQRYVEPWIKIDASSEHFLDKLFIVKSPRLVLVRQADHSVQFFLGEFFSKRLEDVVELLTTDCTVAVDVELVETLAHQRLPATDTTVDWQR